MPTYKISKPPRFKPKMAAPLRRSSRVAAAAEAAAIEAAKPKPVVEEIRGVTVSTWPLSTGKGILISEGMYTTDRYAERIAAHGGVWLASESAWRLPLGADVRFILSPAAKPRPSWVCCEKAEILSIKNKHYSCKEHTMYYEDCHDQFGNPIKILYSCSTCGGSPYTGT